MPEAKVTAKYQVTIPQTVRQAINIEAGDVVEFHITKQGTVTLRPKKARRIPKEEAWFWTPEWQQMMREAEDDLKEGRFKDFDDVEDLIKDLNRQR
jgi:AbrB family looped-hinge helix DNA binding protein